MAVRKLRTALLALALVFAANLGLDAFLLLRSSHLERWLRSKLATVFRPPVEIREIGLSLHGLVIRGVSVRGPDGERMIAVDEATVSVDWRRLALGEIRIVRPFIDLRRGEDGQLSLLKVLDPSL